MNNLVIKRSQIVEAKLSGSLAVGKRYNFTDIPNLSRNSLVIYGWESFTTSQLTVTPTGNSVVPVSTGIVITWRDTNKQEFIYQIPMYTTIRANNAGLIVLLQPRVINLTDSYVTLTDTTGLSVNQSVAINLYYDLV
jgi:hypothetical protein